MIEKKLILPAYSTDAASYENKNEFYLSKRIFCASLFILSARLYF